MKKIAAISVAALTIAACQMPIPRPPEHITEYDFGPFLKSKNPSQEKKNINPQKIIHLAPLENKENQKHLFYSTAIQYRLLYENKNIVHQFAQSRWADYPARIIEQRLRQNLATHFSNNLTEKTAFSHSGFWHFFNPTTDPASLQNQARVLKIAIQNFDWHYVDEKTARATVTLAATLDNPAISHVFTASRTQVGTDAQNPPSADAAAALLAESCDETAQELAKWLAQVLNP